MPNSKVTAAVRLLQWLTMLIDVIHDTNIE